MMESVTDVIVARSQRHDRLGVTFVSSAVAHAVTLALFVLMPHTSANEPPRHVMTISLGGAVGPRTGGLTQIGGQPVQQVAPAKPEPRVERAAAVPPKMSLPAAKPRPKPAAAKAPDEAVSRAATTGPQIVEGSTPIDTGARGKGFGVSSAGGVNGGPVTLDVRDFCCPDYLELMIVNIRRNWLEEQGRSGSSVIRFTIHRDGSIDAVTIDRPSGFLALDMAASRAVQLTSPLPRLPAEFPNQTLTVHMTFSYLR